MIETRINADLQLSSTVKVIPELQRLASRYPERERFRAQLMLALYRCGRQADAFAAFREAWQFSVDELGVGPGPELTDLHKRILAGDAGPLKPVPE